VPIGPGVREDGGGQGAEDGGGHAATVGVEELPTDPRQVNVVFEGAAAEANRLTVPVAGEGGDFYDLRAGSRPAVPIPTAPAAPRACSPPGL